MNKITKNLTFLICFVFLHILSYSAVKVPNEIKFDNEKYKLAFQDGDGVTTQKISEYLRSGEDLESYVKLIGILEFPNNTDVKIFAENLILLHEQKYPLQKREMFMKSDGSEALISYIITDGDITEFNIFKLVNKSGHVVIYQFVFRNYSPKNDPQSEKWLATLEENKDKWITQMGKANFAK